MHFHLPSVKNGLGFNKKSKHDCIECLYEDWFNDFSKMMYTDLLKGFDGGFTPKVDISEKNSTYFVEVDLPGVNQDDIEVKIDNGILNIKGKKESIQENKDKNYYSRERYYGEFNRSISLPSNIDEDKVDASFKDGVLNVKIPIKNAKETRKISIKK